MPILTSGALLLVLATGCGPRPLDVIGTAHAQGVVLPMSLAATVLNQCSRPTPKVPDSYWEPTEQDVRSVEQRLSTYLQTRLEPQAQRVLVQLSQYRRQYAGFIRAGHRTIYVNFFLPEYGEQWRRQTVLVCDGGVGFWGVEFDSTSNTFVHVAYNNSL
jgi:hypothetical protein